jgi:DNA ligase-1
VAEVFGQVAAAAGPGSRTRKGEAIRALFGAGTAEEREILRRLVQGEMRIGLSDGLIQDAIATAAGVEPDLVRRALLFVADPSVVARLARVGGAPALREAGIQLFVPLLPMLAEPAAGADAVLSAHGGRTALEVKYDGARIQLHHAGAIVRIWSRRLTEITASVPDVVARVRPALRARSCILDGEVIGVGTNGRPLPFQDLMRRLTRVHAIETAIGNVPLEVHLFDCLFRDGQSLIDLPYEARWAALSEVAEAGVLARRSLVGTRGELEAFLTEARADGHEGLIAKALDSPYTPGSRGKRWLKLKPAQTLDCVIVAADRGSGRRTGWLSNYHLAVRDGDGFAPVGKTFKGLTDAEFAAMTERLRALAVSDDGYTVRVQPAVVVEVAYNEIQRSPQYSSGLALRFARITRIREDKSAAQATTLAELQALFARQSAPADPPPSGLSE